MCFIAWLPLLQRISYRIIALVWRCLLGLAPPIYATSAALPQVLRVVALSALLSGACSWSLLLTRLLSRIAPSQSLAPRSGTGSLWLCDCIPESTLNLSILASKLSFSAVLGSGALLSSNLEGALYKSSQ